MLSSSQGSGLPGTPLKGAQLQELLAEIDNAHGFTVWDWLMPNGKELILKPLNTTHKEVLKATYKNRVRWYCQLKRPTLTRAIVSSRKAKGPSNLRGTRAAPFITQSSR